MTLSPRLRWPVPEENQDPWYPTFTFMVQAMDASAYASREDRHLIFLGGGDVCFDAGTNSLSWSAPIYILAAISGFFWTIPAGSLTIAEGQLAYMDLARAPTQNTAVELTVTTKVPNSDIALIFCIRKNDRVVFHNGVVLVAGCFPIFDEPRGAASVINTVPSPKDVSGVFEVWIGSVYLNGTVVTSADFLMGNQTLTDAATLTVRRNSDSAVLFIVGPHIGALTTRSPTLPVSVPSVGWYDVFLQSDNAVGTSICGGIHMEVM